MTLTKRILSVGFATVVMTGFCAIQTLAAQKTGLTIATAPNNIHQPQALENNLGPNPATLAGAQVTLKNAITSSMGANAHAMTNEVNGSSDGVNSVFTDVGAANPQPNAFSENNAANNAASIGAARDAVSNSVTYNVANNANSNFNNAQNNSNNFSPPATASDQNGVNGNNNSPHNLNATNATR